MARQFVRAEFPLRHLGQQIFNALCALRPPWRPTALNASTNLLHLGAPLLPAFSQRHVLGAAGSGVAMKVSSPPV